MRMSACGEASGMEYDSQILKKHACLFYEAITFLYYIGVQHDVANDSHN